MNTTNNPWQDILNIFDTYNKQLQNNPEMQKTLSDTMLFWQSVANHLHNNPMAQNATQSTTIDSEIINRLNAIEQRLTAIEETICKYPSIQSQ